MKLQNRIRKTFSKKHFLLCMVRIEEDNIVFWTPLATFFFKGVFSRIIFKAFSVNRAFRITVMLSDKRSEKFLKIITKVKI